MFDSLGDLTGLGCGGVRLLGEVAGLVGVLARPLVGVVFGDAGEQVGFAGQ